ncbi:MAG: hypothetical protein HN726_01415 [Candidatus Magasanikbacteria bacterium]|jgi:translin|nr:hypothetical protein [Candidatus Magasanikbacteria bacterium]MBT4221285.1 hypothetical protein [Candidatus Magasanikbacteria bacterium]MBT4350431.1 hypothetical protein [Candidatus Magasanikbacteria bacterium]MBT4542022.1 hypothetical protein [Candidatus Magasanikbacteria bacterium]MBT6253409.1 hypothetical protein [Candidatus Magasanikbacteria bacterium]
MLQKTYLTKLKKEMLGYAEKRRAIIKTSDDGLYLSKRSIFAMHRGNMKEAKQKIDEAEKKLKAVALKYKKGSGAKKEGSYKAALEEYVEAKLLYQFISKGKIGQIKEINVPTSIYIAGLCDVPGELYRYAIKAATNNDIKTVHACSEMAQEIIGELIEFNLTSYLRNKFDQAKGAVRKIEHVVYEVSLRK